MTTNGNDERSWRPPRLQEHAACAEVSTVWRLPQAVVAHNLAPIDRFRPWLDTRQMSVRWILLTVLASACGSRTGTPPGGGPSAWVLRVEIGYGVDTGRHALAARWTGEQGVSGAENA